MNQQLVKNLKRAMHEHELNVIELARMAQLKPSFIYDILNGKSANPGTLKLARIATALNIPLTQLIGLEEKHATTSSTPDSNYVMVSSILTVIAASSGKPKLEDREGDPYYFRRSWIIERLGAKPESLRMVFIEGDSMEPTLCQGDMVLIDITKCTPSPPGIFVLFDGLGLVAKRLEFISNSSPPSIRILSDNPQYIPYDRLVEETKIMGRVIWFSREI